MFSKLSLPAWLRLAPALALLAVGLRAQDAPAGVPVRFNADASIYVNGSGEPATIVLDVPVATTADHSDGLLELVDQAGSGAPGTLSARPSGSSGIDPRFVGQLEPGKLYSVAISGNYISDVSLTITPPPGYEVEIDGAVRTLYIIHGDVFVNEFVPVRVLRPDARFGGRAGTATSIESGRVKWEVALGGAKGGLSAGSLAVIDSGTSANWDTLFTPYGLQYEALSPEIAIERDSGGAIRQVLANEACVDVVTLSSTSYELRFYHFDQMAGSSGVRTFAGYPFVTYRLEQDGTGATKLKITSETRQLNGTFTGTAPASSTVIGVTDSNAPIARTAVTSVERTGTAPAFTWNLNDWNTVGQTQLVQEQRTWGGTTSARTESINLGSGVTRRDRAFNAYNWGEEVVSVTDGASPTPSSTATMDYYTSLSPWGSYGALRSRSVAGTSSDAWEGYEYDLGNFGVVTRIHRPYQGSPSSVPSDLTSDNNGEITSFSYTTDAFGHLTRPTLIETNVNGTLTAKATISYSTLTNFGGRSTLNVVSATRTDYSASGTSVTTVTKYFQEDAGLILDSSGNPIRAYEAFLRSQPYSVTTPDGVRRSFAHQLGSWNGSAFTPSTNGGLDDGTASRTAVITGSSTTGSSYTTYDGFDIDDLFLVTGKSTLQTIIRDQYARVVRTETYAWSGSAWVLVASSSNDTYDWANQLTHRVDSNGAEYDAQYNGELKQWEKSPTGFKLSYTYDAAGRVAIAEQESATGISTLTTSFSYDAENRVTQQVVGTSPSETITSSRSYDNAGRLASESRPGPNGAMTASYTYVPASRQVTVTLPNGGTRIQTWENDGRLAQVTGTAVVPEYYTYSTQGDGSRYSRVNVGTSTGSRLRESWLDWMGRTTKTSRPGFATQPAFVEQAYFDSVGRLAKTTRADGNGGPLYADTLYEYDTLGQLTRTGLDLGANAALDVSSTDRLVDLDRYFENVSSAWWLTEIQKTYPKNSSATAITTTTRRRLTGFSGNLRAETITIDGDGNTTDQTESVDRTNKTRTATTTISGIANSATQTYVNDLPTSATGFDGVTRSTGYDALHRANTATDPRTGTRTTFYKSGSTFVWYVQDAVTPTPNTVVTYTYDNAGRMIAQTDAAGKVSRTEYNTLDQVVHQWGDVPHPVEFTYNSLGERTNLRTYRGGSGWNGSSWPSGTTGTADVTTWAYDAPSGLLSSKTDAASKSVTYTYNARGQMATRVWARTPSVTTTYGYDGLTGELLTQTYSDSTPSVTLAYTRAGGLDTVGDATGTRTFIYNPTNPLQLDAVDVGGYYNGRVLTRQYDGIKRPNGFLLGTTGSPSGDLTQTYTYQASTGRFDHLDTASSALASRTLGYSYNTGGLVSGLAWGTTFTVTRSYEGHRDLLTAIDAQWSATSRTRYDYTYNALGQRDTVKQSGDEFTASDDFGGSTYYRYIYNARGELTEAVDYFGTDPTSTSAPQLTARRFGYALDNAGNRTSATRSQGTSVYDVFTPNALNQYSTRENDVTYVAGTAQTASVIGVAGGTTTATIGRAGRYWGAEVTLNNTTTPGKANLTVTATLVGGGAGGADLVRTDPNHFAYLPQSLQSFTYDDDGNLTGDGVWTYAYDAENRLIQMTTTSVAVGVGFPNRTLEFKYDYLGRRVQKRSVNSTAGTDVYRRYLYDGDNLVAEFDATSSTCGSLLKSYTWGLDLAGDLTATGGVGALVQITDHGTGASYFPTYDGNGNVAALIQTNTVGAVTAGTMVAKYEYSPFGELLRAEGSYAAANPFRFSTKFTDDESGLVYYGARYYSSTLGRFINRDPIEEAGGLNLYGFCGHDAVNGVDVLGMEEKTDASTDSSEVNPWDFGYPSFWNALKRSVALMNDKASRVPRTPEPKAVDPNRLGRQDDAPDSADYRIVLPRSRTPVQDIFWENGVVPPGIAGMADSLGVSFETAQTIAILGQMAASMTPGVGQLLALAVVFDGKAPVYLRVIAGVGVVVSVAPRVMGVASSALESSLSSLDDVGRAFGGPEGSAALPSNSRLVLLRNGINGEAWEGQLLNSVLPETQTGLRTQITIRSNGPSNLKVRMDIVGKDGTGAIRLTDGKSSPTAPLQPNQVIVYPELEIHGGVVVGKGKAPYTGGTAIPPTKVDILIPPQN